MEDKLKAIFDAMTEEDVKELIDSSEINDISFNIDIKTVDKIKSMTFAKAGLPYNKKAKKTMLFNILLRPKLAAVAAILIIAVGVLSIFGFENVVAAVNKFFRFIPDFGIITEEDPIIYAARERNLTVENDTHKMTIRTAIATPDTVTVFLDVIYKEFERPGEKTSKQEILEKLEHASREPGLYLCNGDEKVQIGNSQIGGGGTDYYQELITGTFYLDKARVTNGSVFELSYDDIGLSIDLNFIAYDSFSQLEDIGPTDVHNDISITAIPSYEDGSLLVELYPINKSKYKIESLVNRLWQEQPVADEELHLETEFGDVPYRLSEGPYMDYRRHFYFDIPQEVSRMTLKIPYIIVSSDEKAEKTISIPELGVSRQVDIPFKFSDGTMRLVEIERVRTKEEGFSEEADGVKLTFRLENKRDNMKLYIATPDKWKHRSSGYRWEYDKDNNTATLWYYPEDIKTGKYKFSLDEPQYIFTDPYIIEFK